MLIEMLELCVRRYVHTVRLYIYIKEIPYLSIVT